MKYKAICIKNNDYLLVSAINIIFIKDYNIINKRNQTIDVKDGQIINTKYWKFGKIDRTVNIEDLEIDLIRNSI